MPIMYYDIYVDFLVPDISKLMQFARELGFSGICICTSDVKILREISSSISKNEIDLDVGVRFSIRENNVRRIKDILPNIRRYVDIISVVCTNREVSAWSARDGRIDILTFDSYESLRVFAEGAARLAGENKKAIEMPIRLLLTARGIKRARLLHEVRRVLWLARRFGSDVVISSGARSIYEMRAPRDVLSIAITLLGLDKDTALKAISEIPRKIIETSREKRSRNFVLPGVRIVGKMGDKNGKV
ncbi:MAG: RNase P subunit p30 family protein [Candidatus Baldrarchaeia archaeon]